MSLGQAVECALEQVASRGPAAPEPYPAGLSAREVDVLRIVADGMTNAEVAKELFLSPRTVDWHLSSIYRKLGLHSRAEATRFAAEHGLIRVPSFLHSFAPLLSASGPRTLVLAKRLITELGH